MRLVIAVLLGVSGFSHAYLYVHGYRYIPHIGTAFLAQASISFALAVLLAIGGPVWLRWAAAGLAAGALVAFVLSRTVGLLGFMERGWEPSPHAAISVAAEAATVVLVISVRKRALSAGKRTEIATDAATSR